MATFIDAYLEHTSIYESPTSFWKWSAYITIAAVLKDHVYLRQGDGLLFPNIYVMFLADSSVERKGQPVNMSSRLIGQINNTKFIKGRATVHAILDELSRTETDSTTGKIQKSGSAIIYAPELSAGIVGDHEGLKTLTNIYDYDPDPFRHMLRTGPTFKIERIVLNMLSATNAAMLKDFWGPAEINGGLLARTFLVIPVGKRPPNSLLRVDNEKLALSLGNVTKILREVGKLSGEIKLTEDAIDEYEKWYHPFKLAYEQRKEQTGIVGRIHTGVLKLAIILAANEHALCVQKKHIEQSIEECIGLLKNYNILTMSNARSDNGQAGGMIIANLLEARGKVLSRKELIRLMWQQFDADMIDKALDALEVAGFLQLHAIGNEQKYGLTKLCLDTMGLQDTK